MNENTRMQANQRRTWLFLPAAQYEYDRKNFSMMLANLANSICRQDSWAIANNIARCAQYMGALKIFESPHYAPGYFSRNL